MGVKVQTIQYYAVQAKSAWRCIIVCNSHQL